MATFNEDNSDDSVSYIQFNTFEQICMDHCSIGDSVDILYIYSRDLNLKNPFQWSRKFNITYKTNYGDITGVKMPGSYPKSYRYGVGIASKKMPVPTRDSYTFDGWYNKQSNGKKISSITTSTKGNLTLYARWTANKPKCWYWSRVGNASNQSSEAVCAAMASQGFNYQPASGSTYDTGTKIASHPAASAAFAKPNWIIVSMYWYGEWQGYAASYCVSSN